GHLHAARGGAEARHPLPPHLDRRGVRRPRARRPPALHRYDPLQPLEPLLLHEGGQRPARARLGALVRGAGDDLQLLEQLRALPARREVHPAADHQRAARRAPQALRHGRERARLDPRRRPLLGGAHDPREGSDRRDLPDRGRRREEQQAGGRAHPPRARAARRRLRPRGRSARARPPLRDRLLEAAHRARLDAEFRRLRGGARGDDRVVSRQRGLVGTAEGGHRGEVPGVRPGMTRYLIAGAGGMLGHDLQLVLAGREVRALGRAELDITDAASVADAVRDVDVVINAAAHTAVDDAESHEDEAYAINATGAGLLAAAAADAGARFVQVSTDYVFRGDAATPYPEDAPLD